MRTYSASKIMWLVLPVVTGIILGLLLFLASPKMEKDARTASTTESSGSLLSFREALAKFFRPADDTSSTGTSSPSTDSDTSGSGGSSKSYKGVYVPSPQISSSRDESLDEATYRLSYIDGIAIRISWEVLEPVNGQYEWSKLDAVIRPAIKNGKKFSLGVGTGDNAPRWLYSEGVPSVTIAQQKDMGSGCVTLVEPVPWSPVYQKEYAQLMSAISQHLKTIPGAYESLTLVKITGINETSQELRFSTADPDPDKPSCVSDGAVIWRDAGYRPSRALASWDSFATSVSTAFPDKVYAQVLNGSAFPPINENGVILKRTDPIRDQLIETVLQKGLDRFSSRFGGVFTALAIESFRDVGQKVYAASEKGGIAFYQTNLYGGPGVGAECGPEQKHGSGADTKVRCTEATYQQLLENGLSHNGTYFEVWQTNAYEFPKAISYLQKRLQ